MNTQPSTLARPEPLVTNAPPLHLTRITVPYDDAIRLLRIRDTYDWHQRIWQAFGDRPDATRDFLIRIDRRDDAYRVVVVSRSAPNKPDWCPDACFQSRLIPDAYFTHPRYRFSLLANPTRKVRVGRADGTRTKNGRRIPVSSPEEQAAWLDRKASSGGFRIQAETLRIIPRGREYFIKPDARGTHTAVEFLGHLEVLNPALFQASLAGGIGSAKAFGFGLLVIAPLP